MNPRAVILLFGRELKIPLCHTSYTGPPRPPATGFLSLTGCPLCPAPRVGVRRQKLKEGRGAQGLWQKQRKEMWERCLDQKPTAAVQTLNIT